MTVTVLDFETGEVHVYTYNEKFQEVEALLEKKGHNINNSQWLCTKRLVLQVH